MKRKLDDIAEDDIEYPVATELSKEWPAPKNAIEGAQTFISTSATSAGRILIVPDRDADGLCSGAILHHLLVMLGKDASDISCYFVPKGKSVFHEDVISEMMRHEPSFVFILDQGSRGMPLEGMEGAHILIIDHHESAEFPKGTTVLTAFGQEPVATSSLLTYITCRPLHKDMARFDFLAIIGTFGNLGTNFKFKEPFPHSFNERIKTYGRQKLSETVSLINAPRRTAVTSPITAWKALLACKDADDMVKERVEGVDELRTCRRQINDEITIWSSAAQNLPLVVSGQSLSVGDILGLHMRTGEIAIIHVTSPCQIHPIMATRWANRLNSKKLRMVVSANDGYIPDRVNFSTRVPKRLKDPKIIGGGKEINLIEYLTEIAKREYGLLEELGTEFANGHAQATGGSVSKAGWAKLLKAMGFVEETQPRLTETAEGKALKKHESKFGKQKGTLFDFGVTRTK